jgi:sugar O-acyltransferase (sialic acid O-acetyltransferase NeuD family)
MSRPLVILGTGGSAYDVLDIVEAINAIRPTWEAVGFLDDVRSAGIHHLGLEVLGPLRDAARFTAGFFVNAIAGEGSFRQRLEILTSTRMDHDRFATLVHPGSSVSSRARLGRGVVVNPGVVVAGGVAIGNHVMLCTGCVVGHESSIGDGSILAPGSVVSGLVEIESSCYIGAGAMVRQKLRVGTRSLIGMGAVVVRDVEPGSTQIGNPARPLRRTV